MGTKKTTFRLVAALAAAVAAVGTLTVTPMGTAAAQSKETPKVSRAAAKPLKAAQDALQAKKYQEALARLREVQGLTNKTPYDEFVMNELLGATLVRMNNYAEAAKALEAAFNSQYFDQSQTASRINALAQVYYQLKSYDKAIDYGNRAVKGGFADEDMYTLVAQAYYLKGDYKNTVQFVDNWVANQVKRRQTPKEQSLQLILNSCIKLDDQECTTQALERLVMHHPKPEYWQNLTYSLFQAGDNSDRVMLHIYRLASEVDVLTRPSDYTEMAQLAIEQGTPGEAQRILERGFAKNVFTEQRDKDRNQRLLQSAKKQAEADQAALAKIASEAAASKTGDKDVGLGLAYMSYEQYDKAAEVIARGLAKGGVRNEAEARLLLGIAQLKAGKKEDATKAFEQVKGDPKLERIANLWSLHARQA